MFGPHNVGTLHQNIHFRKAPHPKPTTCILSLKPMEAVALGFWFLAWVAFEGLN